uniref:Uncharacterized protein n=1 Tax=Ditylenchus dipsaci TaxID=166011 RepID=A0A915D731_9BILA
MKADGEHSQHMEESVQNKMSQVEQSVANLQKEVKGSHSYSKAVLEAMPANKIIKFSFELKELSPLGSWNHQVFISFLTFISAVYGVSFVQSYQEDMSGQYTSPNPPTPSLLLAYWPYVSPVATATPLSSTSLSSSRSKEKS